MRDEHNSSESRSNPDSVPHSFDDRSDSPRAGSDGDVGFGAGVEQGSPPRSSGPKKARRSRSTTRKKASASSEDESSSAAPRRAKRGGDAPSDDQRPEAKSKRPRSRRGSAAKESEDTDAPPERESAPTRAKRSRRGGRRRKSGADVADSEEGRDQPDQREGEEPREDRERSSGEPERKKRSRRPRSRRKAGTEDDAPEQASDEAAGEKRPSSRGRGRGRSLDREAEAPEPVADEDSRDRSDGDDGDGEGAKTRRRRGSRGGRRRKKSLAAGVDHIPGEDEDFDALPREDESSSDEESTRGRRKTTKKASRKTSKKASTKPTRKASSSREPAKKTRKKTTKAETTAAAVERTQMILVNAVDREEKRVAVVDNGRIIDFLMTSESQKTLVNDIYRGRVVNLETAIGAAFIDFGQGRNGFLHTSDVLDIYGEKGFSLDQLLSTSVDPADWDENSQPSIDDELEDSDDSEDDERSDDDDESEAPRSGRRKKAGRKKSAKKTKSVRSSRRRQPISDLLKVGNPVVVQVTKDAIGDKGPTLTTYISIPGRYLVLMPSMARTGVSRKIPDDKERRRLKRILTSLNAPEDMGVIVRTAGVGKTKTDLKRDLSYLLGVWENFGKRLKGGRGPMPLYQESDVAIRTLRDLFNPKTKEVVVDDPVVYDQLIEFARELMPEHLDRITLHEEDRPVFHHYGIEQDFEKIFTRRVELPSGGSIVFDPTEALVAIDVNSGRTRTDGFDFEEIALKTNLEAVPEIARQIRLRDLGGIIVCDFIDMMKTSSMRTVERSLRTELADDRARSKLGRISQFGLLEMTRQRLGPGTHKKVFQSCPRCRGTARIRTVESRAAAILRRLGSALTQKGFSTVEVRAHPEVVEYLQDELTDYVRALEHRFERDLKLTPVPDQTEDSVLRYLRTDGREVRPGGRRKR